MAGEPNHENEESDEQAVDEKVRSYYYDDAHGYTDYDPDETDDVESTSEEECSEARDE